MRLTCSLLVLFAVVLLQAEVVDRVALTVGNQAITESQVSEEVRVTALLNHQPVTHNSSVRREAAARMIQQFLIRRETEATRFPAAEAKDIDAYQAQLQRDYGGAERLEQALQQYGLDADTLRAHLTLQLTALRFVAFRFQPDASTVGGAADVERRTDDALAAWLAETQKRSAVVYLDKALAP